MSLFKKKDISGKNTCSPPSLFCFVCSSTSCFPLPVLFIYRYLSAFRSASEAGTLFGVNE